MFTSLPYADGMRSLSLSAILVAVAASDATHASPPLPRVFAWTAPASPPSSQTQIRPLVMANLWSSSDPATVADEICNKILQLGLGKGEVAITILGFGRGSLAYNPSDALIGSGLPDSLARGVPWMNHGVATMSAWTDSFIARYKQRQITDGVPSPSRFHMDCELRLPALCYLPDVSACWANGPMQVFAAMQLDARWNSEQLRMKPENVPTLQTAAQAYIAAGSPAFDVNQPRDAAINRAWSSWWDGFTREAVDGALDEALYSRVAAAWPGAMCSEFAESMRLDGGTEPDGSVRGYVDFEWWNQGWMRSRWCGRASLQAPAFYVFGETFVDLSRPFMDEQMRLHRANLDACLHSFGGASATDITPWVTLPGILLPYGESPATNIAYLNDEFLRIAALFKSRGIEEFMLWPSTSSSTWHSVGRSIDAAWSTELSGAEIASGTSDIPLVLGASVAERVASNLTSGKNGIEAVMTFTSSAVTACSSAGSLWIAIESRAGSASDWTVDARASAAVPWSRVASYAQSAESSDARWIGPIAAAGLVANDGSFEVRLRTSNPATSLAVDLIQAIRVPSSGSDLNGDGAVNSLDLAALLGAWGSPDASADINGDGLVGSADLSMLLNGWGGCG